MLRALPVVTIILAAAVAPPAPGAPLGPGGDVVDNQILAPPAAPGLAAALREAIEAGWDELFFLAACHTDRGLETVEVYGSGTGIWDGSRQFHLPDAAILDALVAFERHGFAAMEELYGGPGDRPDPGRPDPAAVVRIVCRVELQLDGHQKQVAQRLTGEQFAPLRDLAHRLLALGRDAARDGVTAADLDDALAKVFAGELAPEVLRLLAHRLPEPGQAGTGWLLRVDGATATLQPFDEAAGYGARRRLRLEPAEVAALAGRIAALAVQELPASLYADVYTDLRVELLGHEKAVKARRFADADLAAQRPQKGRFDRFLAELDELRRRTAREGRPVAP